MKKQNLILSAALVAVFSASTAFAEAEVTGKIVHESAKFTTSGSTVGTDYSYGYTAAGINDPRGSYWGYWYGTTLATGHETMAFIPRSVTKVNHKYENDNLWSTRTLKKMPRNIK